MTVYNGSLHPRDPLGKFASKGGPASSGLDLSLASAATALNEIDRDHVSDCGVMSKAEWVALVEDRYGDNPMMSNYYKKEKSVAVRVDGRVIAIDKPPIKPQVWVAEYGHDYDEKAEFARQAQTSKDFFIAENTKDSNLRWQAEHVSEYLNEGAFSDWTVLVNKSQGQGFGHVSVVRRSEYDARPLGFEDMEPVTREGAEAYLAALEEAQAQYRKRLETWWKRYSNKFSVSTFWGDR